MTCGEITETDNSPQRGWAWQYTWTGVTFPTADWLWSVNRYYQELLMISLSRPTSLPISPPATSVLLKNPLNRAQGRTLDFTRFYLAGQWSCFTWFITTVSDICVFKVSRCANSIHNAEESAAPISLTVRVNYCIRLFLTIRKSSPVIIGSSLRVNRVRCTFQCVPNFRAIYTRSLACVHNV